MLKYGSTVTSGTDGGRSCAAAIVGASGSTLSTSARARTFREGRWSMAAVQYRRMPGIRPLPALVAVCLIATSAGAAAAPGVALRNESITARFDGRGLVSLAAGGEIDAISTDAFAVSIDGRLYDSRSMAAPGRSTGRHTVTFAWTAGAHRVSVVYQLQPGWRFLSKRIEIAGARPLHVDEVVVIRASLARPFAGSFVPRGARPSLGTADYGVCLRIDDRRGLLAVAQNPFLKVDLPAGTPRGGGREFVISYRPDIDWDPARGAFAADRCLLAPYRLTGRVLPARMRPEWSVGPDEAGPGMDEAEAAAFTDVVRAFVLAKPSTGRSTCFVPWCLNDYQIDVASAEGRTEYKRILDSGGRDWAPSTRSSRRPTRTWPSAKTAWTTGAGRTCSGSASARRSAATSGT